MNFIPTTATAAEKLKRLAKKMRKESRTSLAVALDLIAKEHGYANWKHVTQCLEQSKSVPKAAEVLPDVLTSFLDEAVKDSPLSTDAAAAFQHGLVFAMDVKDADDMKLGDDVVECDEAWPLAAADIWKVYFHAKDDETGTALVDDLEGEDLVIAAQDSLNNYRLFRYTGTPLPTSLDEAFARVLGRFFFPPTYVWLRGQFIDMEDVREVRVSGKVIYSSTPAGQVETLTSLPSQTRGGPEEPQAEVMNLSKGPHSGIIPRLTISKLVPGLYEYQLTYGGQEMLADAGFSTIRDAIESAIDITGDIRGSEVAYAGVTIGTYPMATLRSSAEAVAQQAVATVAALHDY